MDLDDIIRVIGRITLDAQLQIEQLLKRIKTLEAELAKHTTPDGTV